LIGEQLSFDKSVEEHMSKSPGHFLVMGLIIASVCGIAIYGSAPETPPSALTGVVKSDAEGPMEGVLVSAKRGGGTITITVVSDQQGRYSFPASKLTPGEYKLTMRAVGYDLAKQPMIVNVGTNGAQADLKLNKTSSLPYQLTSAEWMMSAPGTPEQKDALYGCVSCHGLKQVFESKWDVKGHQKVLVRMRNYSPASNLTTPRALPYHMGARPNDPAFAEYLSSINLSGGKTQWEFELQTLPRPKGKSTQVMITEYDLPRPDAVASFAVMDQQGIIWYDDFVVGIVGRLDPRTGETKEWPLPVVSPGYEPGSLCVKIDKDGNVWIARSFQAAVARFDPKTEKVTTWPVPAQFRNEHSRTSYLAPTPQGKVWFEDTFNRIMHLLDPATGQILSYPAFPGWKWDWETDTGSGGHGKKPGNGHFLYSVGSDSRGWGYFTDFAGSNIGEMDPQGNVKLFPVPTVNSGSRLMHIDSQDRIWFGEDYAAKIAMFDIKTRQFKEWNDPLPLNDDYDAILDKAGYVWTGGMATDLVTRLDPRTGEMTQFMLPSLDVNIRGIDVNNFSNPPGILFGENHQARIAIVTPLK
jgi:streptogramin lyase